MEDILQRAIAAIDRAGADWVLVGAEAVNLYARPRATADVDLIIGAGRLAHVLRELRAEFQSPEEIDISAAVRIPSLNLDLIRSNSHPLFRIALERAVARGSMRIPPPEVVIALKFLSSISPWRAEDDRKQDSLDWIRVYRNQAPQLDRTEMIRLSGLAYPGAEREFQALLDKIDRGEELRI